MIKPVDLPTENMTLTQAFVAAIINSQSDPVTVLASFIDRTDNRIEELEKIVLSQSKKIEELTTT